MSAVEEARAPQAGSLADGGLFDHAEAWERISPDPFSGPHWYQLWLAHYGQEVRWRPAAAWANGRLHAVAPFVELEERRFGVPLRVLALAGNLYSPVTTIAFDREQGPGPQCTAMLDEALARPWDVLRIPHLPEETGAAAVVRSHLRSRGIPYEERDAEANWYLPVTTGADDYLAGLHKFSPSYIRRRERKLSERGSLSLDIVTGGPGLEDAIREYYRVYSASWKKPEPDATFHGDLATLAAGLGWLRVGLLRVDGQAVAAQLWLVRNRVAYIVKLAYDEAYSGFSPGAVLTAFLMRHVIDEDCVREVDYLRGDEPYKKDWMTGRRTRRRIVAFNTRTVRGRCLLLATRYLRPLLRRRPDG